jgi:hypothetical protein
MSPCMAFHMGDLTVDSYLNEPLAAKINIEGEQAHQSLNVFLTSRKTYEALSKEAPPWLEKVKVDISSKDAKSYISLSTQEPIDDLFAELIVNAKVDEEVFTKPYTLLLNPRSLANQSVPKPLAKQKELEQVNLEAERKILYKIGELEKRIVALHEVNQDILKKYEFIKHQNETLLTQINQITQFPTKTTETQVSVSNNKSSQFTARPLYDFLQNNLFSLAYYLVKAQMTE